MTNHHRIDVFFHNNCFDGVCSSAVFSRLYQAVADPEAIYTYRGMSYGKNAPGPDVLTCERNAIVDFQFLPSDRLTWWIDHHRSAFRSPAEKEHYETERERHAGRWFYDPEYPSCTKLIADVGAREFDCRFPELDELVTWANIIDSAGYESAAAGINYEAPAQALALVVQSGKVSDHLPAIITLLQTRPLAEVVAGDIVQPLFRALHADHLQALDIIGRKARCEGGVAWWDVVEEGLFGYSKFIGYSLFPEAMYTADVSQNPNRKKITLGFNPWCGKERRHNLAEICERYGGGGHAVVGAFPVPDDPAEVREILMTVVKELQGPGNAGATISEKTSN